MLSYWNLSRINPDSTPWRPPLTNLDPVLDEEGPSSVVQPSFNQKVGLVVHTWQGCSLMEVGGVPCPSPPTSLPLTPLPQEGADFSGQELSGSALRGHSGLLAGCLCCGGTPRLLENCRSLWASVFCSLQDFGDLWAPGVERATQPCGSDNLLKEARSWLFYLKEVGRRAENKYRVLVHDNSSVLKCLGQWEQLALKFIKNKMHREGEIDRYVMWSSTCWQNDNCRV